jgi:hypothetical protein
LRRFTEKSAFVLCHYFISLIQLKFYLKFELTVAGLLFFIKKRFKGSRVTILFRGLKARTVPATVNRRFASLFRGNHGHSLFQKAGKAKKSA